MAPDGKFHRLYVAEGRHWGVSPTLRGHRRGPPKKFGGGGRGRVRSGGVQTGAVDGQQLGASRRQTSGTQKLASVGSPALSVHLARGGVAPKTSRPRRVRSKTSPSEWLACLGRSPHAPTTLPWTGPTSRKQPRSCVEECRRQGRQTFEH